MCRMVKRRGFAAAPGGKAPPFRWVVQKLIEAATRTAAWPQVKKEALAVSRRLTAMCCGKAA
jgi:hypothetical protein